MLLPSKSFSVSICVDNFKVVDSVCVKFIHNFIDQIPSYDFRDWYVDLEELYDTFRDKDKKYFCDQLERYVRVSNDVDDRLQKNFGKCGPRYLERFQQLQSFDSLLGALEWTIGGDSFIDYRLNRFKLNSIQQKIHLILQQKQFPQNEILEYLGFVQELLKHDIEMQVMIEQMHYFNNIYLREKLFIPAFTTNSQTKDTVRQVDEILTEINVGDAAIGVKWLTSLIVNQDLQQVLYEDDEDEVEIDIEPVKELTPIDRYLDFDKFTVIGNTQRRGIYRIEWYFILRDGSQIAQLNLVLLLKEIDNEVIVERIAVPDVGALEPILKDKIIEEPTFNLSALFQFLDDNSHLYLSANFDEVTVCDTLEDELKDNLKECNDNMITVSSRRVDELSFDITIDELFNVKLIKASNRLYQDKVDDKYGGIKTNETTIASLAIDLVGDPLTESQDGYWYDFCQQQNTYHRKNRIIHRCDARKSRTEMRRFHRADYYQWTTNDPQVRYRDEYTQWARIANDNWSWKAVLQQRVRLDSTGYADRIY